MTVSSLIELYTTYYGWEMYTLIWSVLAGTGLILIPFLILVWRAISDPSKSASLVANASTQSVRIMQWDGLAMLAVLLFAGVPLSALSLNELNYQSVCGGVVQTDVNAGDTNTTLDTLEPINTATTTTRMPYLWAATLQIAGGVNHAVISNMACFPNIARLDALLRNLTIADESLRAETDRFANECFLPAKSKVTRSLSGGEYQTYIEQQIAAQTVATRQPDIYYLGSSFYLNTPGLYQQCNTPATCGFGYSAIEPVQGFPYDALRDTAYNDTQIAANVGTPRCDEWWGDATLGLRGRLAAQVQLQEPLEDGDTDNALTTVTNLFNAVAAFINTPSNQAEREDFIIQRFVSANPPEFTGRTDTSLTHALPEIPTTLTQDATNLITLGAIGTTAGALVGGKALVASSLIAGKGIASDFAGYYVGMWVLKQAAPMIQAIILMLIYMLLPFYLVVTEYDVTKALTAVFLILTVKFFSSIWVVADYLDSQLFVAMFPDASIFGSVFTFGPKRIILDIVLTSLYVVGPMALLVIMGIAGQQIGRIGSVSDSLGQNAGSLGRSTASRGANATPTRRAK